MTTTSKNKKIQFRLIVACIALAALWYCFIVVCFLGLNIITNSVLELYPDVYNLLLSIGGVVILFIASALSMPFAVWVFRKLHVQSPVVSSIAFFMSFVFASTLFSLIIDLRYYGPTAVYVVLAVSVVAAILTYGLFIRWLKHRLPTGRFIFVSIGLALVPLVIYALHRLWISSILT